MKDCEVVGDAQRGPPALRQALEAGAILQEAIDRRRADTDRFGDIIHRKSDPPFTLNQVARRLDDLGIGGFWASRLGTKRLTSKRGAKRLLAPSGFDPVGDCTLRP